MTKDVTEKTYSFSTIKAIVGLGNPGAKYNKTRHNIGFRIVDALCSEYGGSWTEKDEMAYAQVQVFDTNGVPRSLHLIKPLTYMNTSGRVIPFLIKKGISGEEILVVHDELEKSFGTMAIRWNGSPRGHNGLRSIQGVIGNGFWRCRFGIGRPDQKSDVGTYVLSPFTLEEEVEVELLLSDAIRLIA